MSQIPLGFWKGKSGGIATDGLVLSVDALTHTSGNTTWANSAGPNVNLYYGALAYNQANGSLLPQYSALYGGSVFFSRDNTSFGQLTLNGINNTSPNAVTVEFWGKLDAATFGAWMPFGFFLSGAFYDLYNLNGGLGFNTGSGDAWGADSARRLNWGLWTKVHHYVVVMYQNQSYTNNVIYINGIKFTDSYQFLGSENAANRNFGGVFNINGSTDLAHGDFYLGEMRVYNRVLTDQEVITNYNATNTRYGKLPHKETVAPANLRNYYDFEGSLEWFGDSGSQVTDYSQLFVYGSLSGGVGWQSGFGGYMEYRSATNRDTALNKTAAGIGIFYGTFSIVSVVRASDVSTLKYIFGSNDAFGYGLNVNVGFQNAGYFHTHNTAGPPNTNTAITLSTNTWYHIVSTYTYDTYVIKIYVNGIEVISNGFQERVVGNEFYYIARANGVTYNFDLGLFMVYNKALSQSEITTLFEAQRTRFGI
jgi:hypothetical protein